MKAESRTYKSLLNSGVALFMFIINFILQFYSRKIFLDYLGTEILGLNTTATNLLQFLNLAELGISSAVGFTLFKPIHDADHITINEILTLQKHLYRRIAYFVILGAVILMGFFPLIFSKITLPLWYAYGSFGVLLFSSLLGYFINYKQVILTASQRDYLVQISYKSVLMIKLLLQIYAVMNFNNGYAWWLIIEAVFAILSSMSLHIATIKSYNYFMKVTKSFAELKDSYPNFTVKIKQMFFHKIGGFALQQSSPLIIYAYTSLSIVALYGNYYMIVLGIISLMASISNSINGGVGNLVAEGNESKIINVFWELFSARFFIITTFCFCAYKLIPAFVTLWIGSQYLLPNNTLILLIIILFIQLSRQLIDSYLTAYALTRDIWSPIVEALINIIGSIILGKFFGLNGILIAVIMSLILMIFCWKQYFLIREGMIYSVKKYILNYIYHFITGSASIFLCLTITNKISILKDLSSNWSNFILSALSYFLISASTLFILMYTIFPSFRQFIVRLKSFINR